MMLAKVCSDKNKPNGQYRIMPTIQDVVEFIKDLPTRKVYRLALQLKILNCLFFKRLNEVIVKRNN